MESEKMIEMELEEVVKLTWRIKAMESIGDYLIVANGGGEVMIYLEENWKMVERYETGNARVTCLTTSWMEEKEINVNVMNVDIQESGSHAESSDEAFSDWATYYATMEEKEFHRGQAVP